MNILKIAAGSGFVVGFLLLTGCDTSAPEAKASVLEKETQVNTSWKTYVGKEGPTGWRCHVVQPDPMDDGPDGINIHDWDGDGNRDLFVNFEQGKYSRLYFNPGKNAVRGRWTDFVQFEHGKCEDSGMGDLDDDGDIDYIANGGWIYFNPGRSGVREASQWTRMTLFDEEQRVPTVTDVDGDGLNDLIVGAQRWYKQPVSGKHRAENWIEYTIGENKWPMNCILYDVDADGDMDMVAPDRKASIFWYENPGRERVFGRWERKTLYPYLGALFMSIADLDGDDVDDFVFAGGLEGEHAETLVVLLRTNKSGDPAFEKVVIDQPCGNYPKGVAVLDLDGESSTNEILVIPKQGDIWMAACEGDPMQSGNWQATPLGMPGAETRLKMDNAYLGDLDGDGDLDVVTTEENGAWGVIWFENPLVK